VPGWAGASTSKENVREAPGRIASPGASLIRLSCRQMVLLPGFWLPRRNEPTPPFSVQVVVPLFRKVSCTV
jgi:hypothetical protein